MIVDKTFVSLEGKVLIASPHLEDKTFEHSLVYICTHDANGAIGIIINQRIGDIADNDLRIFIKNATSLTANKEMEQKRLKATKSLAKKYPVLFGGPVYSDRIIILGLTKEQEGAFDINQNVTLYTDMGVFLKEYLSGRKHTKLAFAKGMAAWESSQLETEIKDNSWLVVPASVELLFSRRIKSKWEAAIKNLGIADRRSFVNYCGLA